jgi:hypothetical protein
MPENLRKYSEIERRVVRRRCDTHHGGKIGYKKAASVAAACLIAAMFVGGLGVHPTWGLELETGTETPGGTHLTVQECNNLGCHYVEAPTCPIIMHDYLPRRWACACPNGTSCLDESSAH